MGMKHGITAMILKQQFNHHHRCHKGYMIDKSEISEIKLKSHWLFFASASVVHHEFLPQSETVNKENYFEAIKHFHAAVKKSPVLKGKTNECSMLTMCPCTDCYWLVRFWQSCVVPLAWLSSTRRRFYSKN